MMIMGDIDLALDFDEFEERAGQALQNATIRAAARSAVEQAQRLVHPLAVCDWLPARRGEDNLLILGPVELHLGRHANLMDEAELACVSVCTIGPDLEEEAKRLMSAGHNLDAYLLGEAGVFAVDAVMARVRRLVEEEAARRTWGVGTELAPGQLAGWALTEQKLVCSLLDIAAIGVRINDSGMLLPQKSASLLVGIGPGYTADTVCAPCDFCASRETCNYRH
jgi:hypothetical protein